MEITGKTPQLCAGYFMISLGETRMKTATDLISSDYFSRDEPGVFIPLHNLVLKDGDYYRHLADLTPYLDTDQQLCESYAEPAGWTCKAIVNVASSGKFSSDRRIAQYANEIWKAIPCPVS